MTLVVGQVGRSGRQSEPGLRRAALAIAEQLGQANQLQTASADSAHDRREGEGRERSGVAAGHVHDDD